MDVCLFFFFPKDDRIKPRILEGRERDYSNEN